MPKPPKVATCTMAQDTALRRNWKRNDGRERRRFGGNAKGVFAIMKRQFSIVILLVSIALSPRTASAQGVLGGLLSNLGSSLSSLTSPQPGVIVRTSMGLNGFKLVCLLHGCTVVGNLGWQSQPGFPGHASPRPSTEPAGQRPPPRNRHSRRRTRSSSANSA